MSPLLIIVIVALVVVFGLGIRYDLKRRHLRGLGDPAAYRNTKHDAQGRADRLGRVPAWAVAETRRWRLLTLGSLADKQSDVA